MRPFAMTTPIDTERLQLRMLTVDDVDAVHAYQSREDVTRYMLFEPRDREAVVEQVTKHAAHSVLEADGDYLELAIVERATGAVVGDIYFTVKSVANESAEIGWALHPDAHGRGIAAEAARAMLAIGFDRMGLHRVVAELDPRNDASVALCLRLGMRHEAHFVRDLMFKGDWADTGVYAILDSEWAASQKSGR